MKKLDKALVVAEARTPAARDQLLVLSDQTRVWCRDLECVYPDDATLLLTQLFF